MSGAADNAPFRFIYFFTGQISAVPARSLVGPSNDFVAVKLWQYYIPVVFFIQDFTDKMILFRFTTFY